MAMAAFEFFFYLLSRELFPVLNHFFAVVVFLLSLISVSDRDNLVAVYGLLGSHRNARSAARGPQTSSTNGLCLSCS